MEEEGCKVCLIEHDPEIHDATLRVRHWFREDLKYKLAPPAIPQPPAAAKQQRAPRPPRKKAA